TLRKTAQMLSDQNWWWVLWSTRCAGIIFIGIHHDMEKAVSSACFVKDLRATIHTSITFLPIPLWAIPRCIQEVYLPYMELQVTTGWLDRPAKGPIAHRTNMCIVSEQITTAVNSRLAICW